MARVLYAAAFLAALAAAAPARATTLATLSATYDTFLEDTVFTITNTSGVSEAVTLTTSLGPITTKVLPNLGAGLSEQYAFNAVNGGFITDPQSAGVADSTSYALLVGLSNAAPTLSSGAFSPLSNLTGGDVDFLGNQCQGFPGAPCGTTIALSGLVASVQTPAVPEPFSITLMLAGLTSLGLVLRRRS